MKKDYEIDFDLSRRKFVRSVRIGSLIFLIPRGLRLRLYRVQDEPRMPVSSDQTGSSYRLKRLTVQEATILEAICARIIPTDDTAGAKEANVVGFIDNMIASQYSAHLGAYREGLHQLDQYGLQDYRRHFPEMTDEDKDLILGEMEQGKISGWISGAAFFSMIRLHTVEGMFSDPAYGGNAGGVGWKQFG